MSLFGNKKSLVIYFSRADENYAVGYIEKGNTEIRIFTTHEGSGLGSIPSQVKRVCKGANVLEDSIAIRGAYAKSSKDKIEKWL